jgi:PIN domain nuclease of toxin-antitoxin system
VFLLDTHTLLWLVGMDRRIRPAMRRRLEAGQLFVSVASAFEFGQLVRLGKHTIRDSPSSWIGDATLAYSLAWVSVDERIALRAADFVQALRDPVDCLIAATALAHDLELVTVDDRLRDLPGLRATW